MPPPLRATAVGEALDSAMVALSASGSPSARLDAEVLLAHALGTDRGALLVASDRPLTGGAVRRFRESVRRRSVDREPVAYIVGRRAFRRLQIDVDPRVLIPRPETELLVSVGIALAPGARVLDVGTGSGAVALALKDERPDLTVAGSDVDAAALDVARANSQRLGLEVSWRRADLLDGGAPWAMGWDAMLSNPPYVADAELAGLAPEISRHEPPSALLAGPDGLNVIRRLIDQAAAVDLPLLAVEIGWGQAPAVAALLRAAGFDLVHTHEDLAGIVRVVVGEAGRRGSADPPASEDLAGSDR